MEQYSVIGRGLPRLDGVVKVTGEARFVIDIKLPGILFGKMLRSPLPHAKILNIDSSRARRLPGVKAIIIAEDTPKTKFSAYGPPFPADKLPLQDDKVRFVGDGVAAVAAVDEDTAEEASELIKMDYGELPAIFDPDEAMQPGAPQIHEAKNNIILHMPRHFGDVEKGFRESDEVFEDRFVTQAQAICCMEVHGWLAQFDHSGRLTLWLSSQRPGAIKSNLVRALNMSPSDVRVINACVGGAFGGKGFLDAEALVCALLAKKTGRPVKLINTREEEFAFSGHRHSMILTIKTGVKRDGRIMARQLKTITDNGAYHRASIIATSGTGYKASQLYAPPNFRFDGYAVYTNNPPGAAFRGFGGPQVHFATESQMDIIAERLGIDPVEIRLRNANKPGQVTASGSVISSCGLSECIKRAAEVAGWKERWGKDEGRGIGVAAIIHSGGGGKIGPLRTNFAESFIKMDESGMVTLLVGEPDVGEGSATVLAQIAAEELGVSLEDMRVVSGDTDAVPLSSHGTGGSRVTFTAGNAVKAAAADLKAQLFEAVAERLEANPEDLVAKDRRIYVKGYPDRAVSMADAVGAFYAKAGRPISGKGHFADFYSTALDEKGYGNPSPTYSFATQVAEVEVDQETGLVKVSNFVAAHDIGFAINPLGAEGQIEGAMAMGIGYALTEKLLHQKGRTLNPNFADYKMLNALDMPPIKPILVETIEPYGPFGAKGIGEPGMVPTAPAIANAIYNAIGVRIKELPLTQEKILEALRQRAQG